ncbi:hydroxymethylglutaryl-CoA synthase [Apiospora phragmitis]|uniref:Hydroxymethylglutaryl-CoA synthase n=1 Tax=Apiospora phragmitis TaxID=2905665 RepID=A0ABR1V0B0_9PEZI
MEYPENVGIKAMEIYVPSQCLDQTLFEKHQGVSAGKYTIGLGLKYMNYCTDREDVCSLALTAVSSLLRKYDIGQKSIGRLEIGTESPIDKAKSVKSILTTLSLFNAVNWVESRSWDGRDAIVVASDIALYNQPASRPTGGVGCVAMLVGPHAPLSLDPTLRDVYMTNTYDFYKPDFKVEFPLVHGHDSITCYQQALDGCHKGLLRRNKTVVGSTNGDKPAISKVLDLFDYMAFHTPNCKLVSKSYGRLRYNDLLVSSNESDWEGIPSELRKLGYEESLKDKNLERALVAVIKSRFRNLISNIDISTAQGKTIGMFSYGSGAASALFTLRVSGDLSSMVQKIDLMSRLQKRHIGTPEEYEQACALRLNAYGKKSYKPVGDIASLIPETYYLESIDGEYRRTYLVKGDKVRASDSGRQKVETQSIEARI